MDAFVVRTRPLRQLFASDCARLLRRSDVSADALVVTSVRRHIEAGGGRIHSGDVDDSAVTLLVVATPRPQLTPALRAEILACRSRHPLASVVPAEWVESCVKQQKRVEEPVFPQLDLVAESQDDDVNETEGNEPHRKKQRVVQEVKVPQDVPSEATTASTGAGAGSILPVPSPDLSRPWKTVANGSLHYWDARATHIDVGGNASVKKPLKMAAFDLDGTLIVTKSGKRFAQNASDWTLFHATRVVSTLQRLARDGFQLVIISNQNGVAKGKTSAQEVQTKMAAIVKKLDVPMVVLFATQDDEMRKPRTGAWRWLLQELQLERDADVDMAASFYCGDAAGRPKIAGRSKDFAATDYKFALNAGLQFQTPEELFLQSTQRIHTRPEMWEIEFDPRSIPTTVEPNSRLDPLTSEFARTDGVVEMVVLTGPPASGKSHLAKRFPGYHVVCQDELKTVAKCVAACVRTLEAGTSVVVDSTNRDPRARREWIALGKKHGVAVRCFVMDVPKPLSMHLNSFRKLTSSKEIPDIAIHTFYKSYVAPNKEEGFDAIVKVRFAVELSSLLDDAHRRLIMSFL